MAATVMSDVSGALMLIRSILRKIAVRLRGSHTRALEEEVARLRAENRALVNSILGVAGIPPMRVLEVGGLKLEARKAAAITSNTRKRQDSNASALQTVALEASAAADEARRARSFFGINKRLYENDSTTPLRGVRRRSWQQIGRTLEIEDALAPRRERESDKDAFPAPRSIVLRHS